MQEIVFHVLFIVVLIREADRLPFVLTAINMHTVHEPRTVIVFVNQSQCQSVGSGRSVSVTTAQAALHLKGNTPVEVS